METESASPVTSCADKAEDISYTIFVLITVFGIIGNIICFLVVLLKCGKTPTNLLLSVIVFVDIVYLVLYLIKNTLNRWTEERLIFTRVVMDELHRVTQLFSVWLVVLLACMRFMAIRKPYLAMRFFSMDRVKVIGGALLFLCVCIHGPFSFVFINNACHNLLNVTCLYEVKEHDRLASDFMFFYSYICYYMCLLFILPCCLVSAFSVSLVKDVRRRRSRLLFGGDQTGRRSSVSSLSNSSADVHHSRHKCLAVRHRNKLEKEGYEVSKLVLTTVIILVVTYSSYFIFGLYTLLVFEYSIKVNCVGEAIVHTTYIVSTINASANFVTNYIFRFSFRRKCSELLFSSKSSASRFWISLIAREDMSSVTRTKTSRL